jgi:hypothetical protein
VVAELGSGEQQTIARNTQRVRRKDGVEHGDNDVSDLVAFVVQCDLVQVPELPGTDEQ